MVKIGNLELGDFPLLLAPMEDVSDPPFRAVCKEQGVDMMYTEFISSEGLIRDAKKSIQKVRLQGGTIPHEVLGLFGAGEVLLKPAGEGTGIKAAGACRSILELAGVHNILTKSLRGNNPHNVVKATFKALRELRSVEAIAKARDKDPKGLRSKN